jgi:hypothetical protein
MDSGLAALVGTVVGGATSIATTWLSEYLRNKRSNRVAEMRKDRLRKLLSGPKYTWRSHKMLCDAIGADEHTTGALLMEIGARRSMAAGRDSWALTSRAKFPDDDDEPA